MDDTKKQDDLFAPFGAQPMTQEEEKDFIKNFARAAEILFGEENEADGESSENKNNQQ